MDLAEKIIVDAMLGLTTQEEAEAKSLLLAAVRHAIFCPYNGKILDIRTAVLIEVQGSSEEPAVVKVMDAGHWDKQEPGIRQHFGDKLTVHDGRVLFADNT